MPDMPAFNVGDRVRMVGPRQDQAHMLGWEGVILERNYPLSSLSTYQVRLYDPTGREPPHEEAYYPARLQLSANGKPIPSMKPIEATIYRLQKRQKFYQTYKQQLPHWYAAYGD